ncbi:MAG: DUF4203 domain-containing protein [Christensenellaceae bacterium]|nr:DUF4203 domain-containing protein [Christensenellaceae bacterium]
MDPSTMVLIACSAGILLSLLTAFFGYRLGRFLLPLSGLLLLEGLIYVYIYSLLRLDTLSTWLFFGGTAVAVYLILFFIRRLAGFFTGAAAAALLLACLVHALKLEGFSLLAPVVMTLTVLSALLTAVYKRVGVIVATAVLGGCAAALFGLYIYLMGVDAAPFTANLIAPVERFLAARAPLVLGVGGGRSLAGRLVQLLVTGKRQVLGDSLGSDSGLKTTRKRDRADDAETWTGDMGY